MHTTIIHTPDRLIRVQYDGFPLLDVADILVDVQLVMYREWESVVNLWNELCANDTVE